MKKQDPINTNKENKLTHTTVQSIQQEIDTIYKNHLKNKHLHNQEKEDTLFSEILEPDIEVSEINDFIFVKVELQGMDTKDIDIRLSSNGYLVISGEKRRSFEKNKKGHRFSECSYGFINRTIPLTHDIDTDNVTADFKNGVLNLKIPKREKAHEKLKKITLNP